MLDLLDVIEIAGLVTVFEVAITVPLGFWMGMRLFLYFLPGMLERVASDKEITEAAGDAIKKVFPAASMLTSGKVPSWSQMLRLGGLGLMGKLFGGGLGQNLQARAVEGAADVITGKLVDGQFVPDKPS